MKKLSKMFLLVALLMVLCLFVSHRTYAETMILPSNLEIIESEAFSHIQVDYILFPENLKQIDDTAFDGASFIGMGSAQNVAKTWCEDHGFEYIVSDDEAWKQAPVSINWSRTNTEGVFRLSWEPAAPAIEYLVYEWQGPYIYIGKTSETWYDVTLSEGPNPERYFFVQPYNGIEGGEPSETVSIPYEVFFDAPKVTLIANNEIDGYLLKWDPIPGAQNYEVCCKYTKEGESEEETIEETVSTRETEYHFYVSIGESFIARVQATDGNDSHPKKGRLSEPVQLQIPSFPYSSYGFGCHDGVWGYTLVCDDEEVIPTLEVPAYIGLYPVQHFDLYNGKAKKVILPGTCKIFSFGRNQTGRNQTLEEVVLGEGIEIIEWNAFKNCKSLRSIHLPSTLKTIEYYAFSGCTALHTINLPENLTNIGAYAFEDCTSLNNITLPNGLKTIERGAFINAKLTSVKIPDGIQTISSLAFSGTSIKTLILPSSVEIIEDEAFSGCRELTTVILSPNLRDIGRYAFQSCPIESVTLPESLRTVGNWAFSSLKTVDVPAGVTIFYPGSFGGKLLSIRFVDASIINKVGESQCFSWCTVYTDTVPPASRQDLTYILLNRRPYAEYSNTYIIQSGLPSGTMPIGEPWRFKGYYYGQEKINTIRATVTDEQGVIVQDVQDVLNVQDDHAVIWFSYSRFDNLLHIEELPLGKYVLRIFYRPEGSAEWIKTKESAFEVVTADAHIYLSGDASFPSGLIASGKPFEGAGTIRANYTIEQIHVLVERKKKTETEAVRDYSIQPESLSIPVQTACVNLHIEDLPAGNYVFTMEVIVQGKLGRAATSNFQIFDFDQSLNEDMAAAIVAFCNDPANRQIFDPFRDYNQYLTDMDWQDYAAMVLCNYKDLARDKIISFFTGSDNNRFVKNLYRRQIINMLAMYDDNTIQNAAVQAFSEEVDSLNTFINKHVSEYLKIGGLVVNHANYWLNEYGLDYALTEYAAYLEERYSKFNVGTARSKHLAKLAWNDANDYLKAIGNSFKAVGKAKKLKGYGDDVIEIFSQAMENHQNGLIALISLINAYGEYPSDEFTEALDEVRIEYQDKGLGIVYAAANRLSELLTDDVISTVEDGILTAAEFFSNDTGGGATLMYKLTTFAIEKGTELLGWDEKSDNAYEFLTIMNILIDTFPAYKEAFDKVHGGDTSGESLKSVYFTFEAMKYTTKEMYEFLIEQEESPDARYQLRLKLEQLERLHIL